MLSFSLRKSRKIFRSIYSLYKRKKKNLPQNVCDTFESKLTTLHESIRTKKAKLAKEQAKELEDLSKKLLPKTFFDKTFDLTCALLFALCVAIVIRQMWFEFYTIPTGSMRPTLKEGDYLVVSKDSFGLNVPLAPTHFYFNEDLVKRGGIVVFTGSNMDIPDSKTMYFYVIPGKKQYVKRLIAKPEDTIYFYGGKIYGFDKEGRDLTLLNDSIWFDQIEHIPFIHFDGKVETPPTKSRQGVFSPAVFFQMNEPVAKLALGPSGEIQGSMLYPKKGSDQIENYYDLWGFRNFAMARILDKNQVNTLTHSSSLSDAPLYLELTHHPSLTPGRIARDRYYRIRPDFSYTTSILPLYGRHINALMNHMVTARFIIKDGRGYRYGDRRDNTQFAPKFPGVENGTYEFDDGTLYRVEFGGVLKEMPKDHPLYSRTYENVQKLYNLGIEWNTLFSPSVPEQPYIPSRYAYYRDGDLFLLGHSIYQSEDPTLQQFVEREKERADGFIDYGAPLLSDGSLDKEFIRRYGLKIPDKGYLALGDNHAMSGDSREFGFVPEDNLKGSAGAIFWPPSKRWGMPFQPPYHWISGPRIFIWGIFLLIVAISYYYHRKRWSKPPKF